MEFQSLYQWWLRLLIWGLRCYWGSLVCEPIGRLQYYHISIISLELSRRLLHLTVDTTSVRCVFVTSPAGLWFLSETLERILSVQWLDICLISLPFSLVVLCEWNTNYCGRCSLPLEEVINWYLLLQLILGTHC